MKYAWLLAAALLVLAVVAAKPGREPLPLRITISPAQLVADGYDTATLAIEEASPAPPRIVIETPHAATVQEISATANGWHAQLRAGVIPGPITVRVEFPGRPPARAQFTAALDTADSALDGTPDFLRLDDADDQRAFRRWFTFLAETQFFLPREGRAAEVGDCAALIRYAYREALRAHDGAWATAAHLPLAPGIASPAKYQYPFTPLGADLFRVAPGRFQPADLAAGAFAQFADAKTLQLRNTHFVTRDLSRAQPGDLLFYRHESGDMPFHSMIYLGESQIEKSAARYLVYHTGPGPDEIRRPTVDELVRFPEPEWRPLPDNPRFLGIYRWNILRKTS
ncbi:MAG TPA: DUF1175 domain-containing protein [Candidatus Solibacter sp.]